MRDDLIVAFDLLEVGYKQWEFVRHGFIPLFIGLAWQFGPKLLPKVSDAIGQLVDPNMKQRTMARWMPKFFIGFATLWILVAFAGTYSGYSKLAAAYETGNFDVVEGVVVDFRPMPKGGRPHERFAVEGVTFTYSDYNVVPGFNNAKSHGGPIDDGIYVRVSYVGNSILKLEVEPNAMIGKEANRSVSLWGMASDAETAENPLVDHPAKPFLGFFWYVGQTFFVLVTAFNWRRSTKGLVELSQETYKICNKILVQLLLLGLSPVLVASLVYISINGAVTEGSHIVSNGVLYAFNALFLLYLNYWVFLRGGAKWVSELPCFSIRPWVVMVYSMVPFLTFLSPAFELLQREFG